MSFETLHTLRKKLWQSLKDQIAQDVREEDAVCEFDCRKQKCTQGEWATCERRIQRAAGELWPASSAAPNAQKQPDAQTSKANPTSGEAAD